MTASAINPQLAIMHRPPTGPSGAASVIPRDFKYRLPLKQAMPIRANPKDGSQMLLCHSILQIAPITMASDA